VRPRSGLSAIDPTAAPRDRAVPRPLEPEPKGGENTEVDRAIALVWHDQRYEGFDAIRLMLDQPPVTFLFAPALALRPVAGLGRRIYRRLASREPPRKEPAWA